MEGIKYKDGDKEKVPFEVAIDKAGFGLYSFSLIGLTGSCIIAYVCIAYGSGMIIPTSACELETTTAQQGYLAVAPLIGTLIGSLFWGYLGDTRGRRKMLLVSLLCGTTFNAIASLSVHWAMLMPLQFLACLFASGQYSLAMTLLNESVPLAKRNLAVLLVTSIFMLSQGMMAVLAIPIIPLSFSYYLPALDIYWNSWRTLMLVYSIPCLVCACWLSLMQESPKYMLARGDEAAALEILRNIHRINKMNSREELQVKGILREKTTSSGPSRIKDQIVPLFRRPLVKYLIIMTTLSVFLQTNPFGVWVPTIANQFMTIMQTGEGSDSTLCDIIDSSRDVPPDPDAVPCAINQTALLIILGLAAVQSVVNSSLSLVVNRFGRRNLVIVITLVCGLSGTFLNLVPNAIGSAIMFGIFLIGILVMGLYTAITMALFPTHLRALAVAMTMTGSRVMNLAVVQIINYLLANNCVLAFYIFPTVFAASSVVASFLPDDRYLGKPQTPETPPQTSPQTKEEDIEESVQRTVL